MSTKTRAGALVERCGLRLELCRCIDSNGLRLAEACACGVLIGDHVPDCSTLENFRKPPLCPDGTGRARIRAQDESERPA